MSFRAKLIILLMTLATLPMGYVYVQYAGHNDEVRGQLMDELTGEATILSTMLNRSLAQRHKESQNIAFNLHGRFYPTPLSSEDNHSLTSYFNELVALNNSYQRILLLSADGQLLASSQSDEPELTVDPIHIQASHWFNTAKDRWHYAPEFPSVMAGPEPNILAMQEKEGKAPPEFVFATPVADARGNLTAILVTMLDFAEIQGLFSQLQHMLQQQTGQPDTLLLLDEQGKVLLESTTGQRQLQLGNNWFEQVKGLSNLVSQAPQGSGERVLPGAAESQLFGYAATGKQNGLPSPGWLVITSRSADSADFYTGEFYRDLAWVLISILGLMLVGSVISKRRLAHSMQVLTQAVQSLSDLKLDSELAQEEVSEEATGVLNSLEMLRYQLIKQHTLERKNNEQRAELLLKDAAIEAATTGIVVADACEQDNPIIYANKAFYRTTGYSEAEVIGRNCRFLQGEDRDQPAIKKLAAALAKGDAADVILRNYRKNGEMFWNRLYISPVRDESGKVTHFVGIETDVTPLKAYEKKVRELNLYLEKRVQSRTLELQQAESQLRATFDTMTDALVVVDEAGVIQQANRTTTAIFGYKTEELIGLDLAILLSKVDNIGNVEQWFSGLLVGTTKKMGALAESSGINKMGKIFPIELSVTGMRIANQREYTVVMRDISERKANEVRLRNARDEAEQANRIKSEFLGNMSHELRTPMNAVIGMTDLVLDSDLTQEQRHHLTIVAKSAHSLLSLLNEILDLTKLERGSMEIELLTFELRSAVQAAITMVEIQAKKKGLALNCEMSSSVANLVVGDPARLRQVLINLVGNAVKFTEQGKVKVSVTPEPGREDYLHFVVEDTGIGIEEERLEQIFNPFVQSDGSISRRYGGTGLGTTISRQLVEKMGGEIWVESELGKGSKFHFTLFMPSATEDAVVDFHTQRQTAHYQSKRPLKILLAEDVAVNAELIQTRLGREGHQIVWAEDGLEARQTYEQQAGDFDLVFMDIHMPNMNGYQAAEAIRTYNESNGIYTPVIALTASGMGKDLEECRDAGMDGFVIKPVDFTLLRAEMARLLPEDFEEVETEAVITEIAKEESDARQSSPLDKLRPLIDVDEAVENWGDEALYTKMLRQFPAQWSQFSRELSELVTENKWQEAHSQIHKLRGVVGGLGMNRVFSAAQEVENTIRAEEPAAKVLGLMSELDDQLSAVILAIDSLPVGNAQQMLQEVLTTVYSVDEVMQQMLSLREMLERGMPDDSMLEQILKGLKGLALDEQIEALAESVDEFDFQGAIETIDRIAVGLNTTAEDMHG